MIGETKDVDSTRECVVCRDDKDSADFPVEPITSACKHPNTICSDCIRQYIEHEVTQGGRASPLIKCPVDKCGQRMKFGDVKRLATVETFDTFADLVLVDAARCLPNFRWCINPECKGGQEHHGGRKHPQIRCRNCNREYCFNHGGAWHGGLTCKDYDETLGDSEKASGRYLHRNAKECPMCKKKIEKDGGCSHMTCSIYAGGCGGEFCWECLTPYSIINEQGSQGHRITCPLYHVPRPRLRLRDRCTIL